MTFTEEKNETLAGVVAPTAPSSSSCRTGTRAANGNGSQLYLMRPDGGEARKITDAKDGVSRFAFSPDGRVARLPGRQVRTRPSSGGSPVGIAGRRAAAEQTHQGQGRRRGRSAGRRTAGASTSRGPTRVDTDNDLRREKKFTVNMRNEITPLSSLWAVDLDPVCETRLTHDPAISVSGFDGLARRALGRASPDPPPNATSATSPRSASTPTSSCSTRPPGEIERLTQNTEVAESGALLLARLALDRLLGPDGTSTGYSMTDEPRLPARRGRPRRPLPQAGRRLRRQTCAWTSGPTDGKTIYFGAGIQATTQLMALDVARGTVRQLTDEQGSAAGGPRRATPASSSSTTPTR